MVATLDRRDRNRWRSGIDRQRGRGRSRIAGRVGGLRRHAGAPWPAGVIDVVQLPVLSTVTAEPVTVSVEPVSAVPLIWMPPAASDALMGCRRPRSW